MEVIMLPGHYLCLWQKLYQAMGVMFVPNLFIEDEEDQWNVYVCPGVSSELVHLGLRTLGMAPVWCFAGFDQHMEHHRHPERDGPYRVSFKRSPGPDICPVSARELNEQQVCGCTLLEALLLYGVVAMDAKHFKLPRRSLDTQDTTTLCIGSVSVDGSFADVSMSKEGRIIVACGHSDEKLSFAGTREVQSAFPLANSRREEWKRFCPKTLKTFK